MANTEVIDSGEAPAVAPAPDQVTLDEFCVRFSQDDKRVEAIGGFYYTERAAGTVKDFESNFSSRFTAYINKPV